MAVTVSSQATMQNSLNQFYNSQTLGTRRSDYGSPQSLSFPADLLTKVSYPYYINIKLSNYTRPSIQSVPIAGGEVLRLEPRRPFCFWRV